MSSSNNPPISVDDRIDPAKRSKGAPAVIVPIAHQAVNQLTVATLCCDSLRRHLIEVQQLSNIGDVDRLEKALLEAVKLIDQAWPQTRNAR